MRKRFFVEIIIDRPFPCRWLAGCNRSRASRWLHQPLQLVGLNPARFAEKFEKDTGIKVNLDVFDSNESLLVKLKAGAAGYNVVVPSDYMVKVMIDEKLLIMSAPQKLQTSKTSCPRWTSRLLMPNGNIRLPTWGRDRFYL